MLNEIISLKEFTAIIENTSFEGKKKEVLFTKQNTNAIEFIH